MSKEEQIIEEQVAEAVDPNGYKDELNQIWKAIDSGVDASDGWLNLCDRDSHYARIAEAMDSALQHTDSFIMDDISHHAVPFILSRVTSAFYNRRTLESLANCVAVEAFVHASTNANGKEIIIPSKEWRLDIAAQMVIHTMDILNISLEDESELAAAFRWIKAEADEILNGDDAAAKA